MSCKTIDVELVSQEYYEVEEQPQITYEFQYCVSYRDPVLNEWILARWFWNDQWVWTPEGVFS